MILENLIGYDRGQLESALAYIPKEQDRALLLEALLRINEEAERADEAEAESERLQAKLDKIQDALDGKD